MKVGDLVRTDMKSCKNDSGCCCFFCDQESSGLGLVLRRIGKGVSHSGGYWSILFDVGTWRLYGNEVEVVNESR